MAGNAATRRLEELIGQRVDMAAFGRLGWWSGREPRQIAFHPMAQPPAGGLLAPQCEDDDPPHLGVEWDEPRDICEVAITYPAEDSAPDPQRVHIEYWQHAWPQRRRDRQRGGHRGWEPRDDPFRGQWRRVLADVHVSGEKHTYRFCHLDITELPDPGRLEEAEDFHATFRRTLKLRVVFDEPVPAGIVRIEAVGPQRWQADEFEVLFGCNHQQHADWSGSVEVFNGHLLGLEPAGAQEDATRVERATWRCSAPDGRKGIRLRVLHTAAEPDSPQRTVVTLRTTVATVSFRTADVLADGAILVPDLGVFVRQSGERIEPAQLAERIAQTSTRSIYDRVADEPEQTLDRAMAETPRLVKIVQGRPIGRYVILGCEGNRGEFMLRHNGHLYFNKQAMKPRGRDVVDLIWPAMCWQMRFGTGDFPDFREREDGASQELLDGYLPIVKTTWIDRDIEFTQTSFACLLDQSLGAPLEKRGDEPIVAMMRFEMRNIAHDARPALLWIQIDPPELIEFDAALMLAAGRLVRHEPKPHPAFRFARDGNEPETLSGWRVQAYDPPRIRCAIDNHGRGEFRTLPCPHGPDGPHTMPTAVLYEVHLRPGESHAIDLAVPFAAYIRQERGIPLLNLRFERKMREVAGYWRDLLVSGGDVKVPDRLLTDFARAVPCHVLVTADKDPKSGHYVVPAATVAYGACGNEACMQIRQLDYRSHHAIAETYLESFLVTQGTQLPDGNFRSAEGALQAQDIYDGRPCGNTFGYNLDHGFILSCLAEHYLLTRDREWLGRVAPNLVAACDFVTRERQATRIERDGEKDPAYGLLPAGHLEDNPEWQHWFAVNAWAHRGMVMTAEALADIDHPQAERIRRDAEAYAADIRTAADRARMLAPVVRLLDGAYIPHLPARTHLRGPDWGWFREGLYGALHLVDGLVLDANSPQVTWILKNLEDNVFVHRDYGRPIDLQKRWFSQGGITLQCNLLYNALAYLARDQIAHAVRALFNAFAASIYPDVRCFTEHPITDLGLGTGPFFKTPDEAAFLNTLRMFLVQEVGPVLWLARGAPRSWFRPGETIQLRGMASYFGPLSYTITTHGRRIVAELELPTRNPPEEVRLRLRPAHRQPMREVAVNGKRWEDFDRDAEYVRLTGVTGPCQVEVHY